MISVAPLPLFDLIKTLFPFNFCLRLSRLLSPCGDAFSLTFSFLLFTFAFAFHLRFPEVKGGCLFKLVGYAQDQFLAEVRS